MSDEVRRAIVAYGQAVVKSAKADPRDHSGEEMDRIFARITENREALEGVIQSALAAAREEGRREGEAVIADLRRSADASHLAASNNAQRASEAEAALRAERAAHAAQLVALRDIVDCACNALTDSIRASGNDARTNMHWVDMLRRKALVPLPDAEAALEKVKEEAVREFLAKEPSGRYRAIPQRCGVWWTFGDDVVSEDVALTEAEARAVANALNALGAKP